jgi:two-component system sensor histidine kinase QseC
VKSIRSFLLTRLLGGTALVLSIAAAVTYVAVTRSLEAQFDRNLSDRVQGFASLLFQVEDHVEFEFSDELMPEYEATERPDYFQLWFRDGELLERSNSLAGEDIAVAVTPTPEPQHWTAPLPDGRAGRYVAQWIEVHHVYPEEGPDRPAAAGVLVTVGRGREELVAAERDVLLTCLLVSLALIGLIAVVSWTAVRKGLEPANRLAAKLDAIHVDRLPERLDVGELPSELQPVADTTDALIRRVDVALQRERRTAADIAHELRTPISELVTVAEVALRNGQDAQETRRALGSVRDVAWRMARSVSTLLKLARLEMGAESFAVGPVDLGEIVAELLRSLADAGRGRGLRVENQVEVGDTVEGDRDVLSIVVSNLVSNALYYSRPNGRVVCRLERSNAGWSLVVENEPVDFDPEDLRTLSEPFWRKDRARADPDRSGLGLALSRALAETSGMTLAFELEDDRFRAILSGGAPAGERPRADATVAARASRGGRLRAGGSLDAGRLPL